MSGRGLAIGFAFWSHDGAIFRQVRDNASSSLAQTTSPLGTDRKASCHLFH